jgi:Nuclease-related domain
MAEPRLLLLRRADRCVSCGRDLDAGVPAEWDPTAKTVRCVPCLEGAKADAPADSANESAPVFERGVPGASAARRHEKLRARREEETRRKYGRRLGGLVLALSLEPQSTQAWGVGSKGERLLGTWLESLQDESRLVVLHDRRIPGSRANIDHIAISRNGVWAIDAKNYTGTVRRVDVGGLFSKDERLQVGRRDCTKHIHGLKHQTSAIRAALGDQPEYATVEVKGALCFVDSEWSFFARPFVLEGVWVGWPKALRDRLLADGPVDSERLSALARRLAASLPSA